MWCVRPFLLPSFHGEKKGGKKPPPGAGEKSSGRAEEGWVRRNPRTDRSRSSPQSLPEVSCWKTPPPSKGVEYPPVCANYAEKAVPRVLRACKLRLTFGRKSEFFASRKKFSKNFPRSPEKWQKTATIVASVAVACGLTPYLATDRGLPPDTPTRQRFRGIGAKKIPPEGGAERRLRQAPIAARSAIWHANVWQVCCCPGIRDLPGAPGDRDYSLGALEAWAFS